MSSPAFRPRRSRSGPCRFGIFRPFAIATIVHLFVFPASARSQVVPDATLPQNTVVTPDGNMIRIDGGTQAGGNLFHSFRDFSIPTGSAALFDNGLNIQNIISRVTGGNLSTIDGLLQTNGAANLFLLNPNGIVFGPNAQLNIGGSFVASTADRLIFDDGTQFATRPETPPLLSVNLPVGLQLGADAGTIVNRSQAVGIGLEMEPSPTGLQVRPGRAIAFVGGEINLEGGLLTAFGGDIELGAIRGGTWRLGSGVPVESTSQLGDIQLDRGARVTTSGLGGGEIRMGGDRVNLSNGAGLSADTFGEVDGRGVTISARQFNLSDRAFVSASTFGAGNGGGIDIRTSESINLTGTEPSRVVGELVEGTFDPLNLRDGLYSFSAGGGDAGNVILATPQLDVSEGATILTSTFIAGRGGNLQIRSDTVNITTGALLVTGTNGAGDAGMFDLIGDRLNVIDDGLIATSPAQDGTGRGGDLRVRGNTVELRGVSAGAPVPGGLFSATLGEGRAGDIVVNANRLVVADGAQVSSSAAGAGEGGNLTVNANEVELFGISADGRFLSGLLTSSSLLTVQGLSGTAPAGNLTVNARRIVVRDGAQISSATGSEGSAGELKIRASESIEVIGVATGVDPSVESVSFGIVGDGIVPSSIESNTSGEGAAGDLQIFTDRLTVRDGAEIGVRGTGEGAAGNLEIRARSLFLDNQGALSAATEAGTGGNISLVVPRIELRRESRISTNAGTADGGNITIVTDNLIALENSDITANAQQGRGGRVSISARGVFGTAFRSEETPASDITATSELGAEFSGAVEISSPEIDPNSGLVTLPTEVIDPSTLVVAGCSTYAGSEFVITGRGGLPPTPGDALTTDGVVVDWIDAAPVTALQEGDTGDIISPSPPDSQLPTPDSPIEARGLVLDADGGVQLVANPARMTTYSFNQWHPQCRVAAANSIGEESQPSSIDNKP
ncbi:S-layer family protein [Lyngbya sp. CCY1209]|uniref:S-layer family protein n=1 Tax=Lyngbya sp. CCY1209 TaxID=2886103 RepID=UPI002D2012DB|nr:S-layer family protein [Lyngbya sp. CCY1209]MEB3885167.1 S-layer family protein [Lyngbya sp. CCY1209]